MRKIVNFHISKGDDYYVASGVELPIVTQALTLDELVKNIREATELHLGGEDSASMGLVEMPAIQASFEVGALEYA